VTTIQVRDARDVVVNVFGICEVDSKPQYPVLAGDVAGNHQAPISTAPIPQPSQIGNATSHIVFNIEPVSDSEYGCRARHQLHHPSGSGARYRSGISSGLRLDDRVYQLAFYSVLASPMIYPTPDFCRLPQTASSGDGERHQPLHAATPSLAFIAASASSLYFRAVTTRL